MNTNKADEAKKEVRSMFIDSMVVLFAIILTIANVIPIIFPAILAYCLGLNKYRNEFYGISKTHIHVAILISAGLLLLIGFLINQLGGDLFNQKMFWQIIIIAIAANLLISLVFFFLGDRRARKKKLFKK